MSALAPWLFRKIAQKGRVSAVSGLPVVCIFWDSATKKVSAIPCVRVFSKVSAFAIPFAFGQCPPMASEFGIAWSGSQECHGHGQLTR
jgi:hypothetical protein